LVHQRLQPLLLSFLPTERIQHVELRLGPEVSVLAHSVSFTRTASRGIRGNRCGQQSGRQIQILPPIAAQPWPGLRIAGRNVSLYSGPNAGAAGASYMLLRTVMEERSW
jgi:hypothetical protein